MVATNYNDWWSGEVIKSYFKAKSPNERLAQWLDKGVLPMPESVIDMGCGHGRNLLLFSEAIRVAAFDPSPDSVLSVKQRSDISKNISVIAGKLPDHPFIGEYFNLVIADGVLHQLASEEDWNLSLATIFNGITLNGWIFLSLFVSDREPGEYHSDDGILWTANDHPAMRLYQSSEIIKRLRAFGGIVVRSEIDQFVLASGSRTNFTVLVNYK
jgi:SAM-dependent methyltransferase